MNNRRAFLSKLLATPLAAIGAIFGLSGLRTRKESQISLSELTSPPSRQSAKIDLGSANYGKCISFKLTPKQRREYLEINASGWEERETTDANVREFTANLKCL